MSRFQVERCVVIARLVRERGTFTRPELDAVMQNARCAVAAKTLNRDIGELRKLGYTLRFDPTTNTWHGKAPKQRIL